MDMRKFSFGLFRALRNLYEEAGLEAYQRKGLDWILRANLCGNFWCIICGSGTAAMVGLANLFGAGDLEFGLLAAIPQVAAVLQIPFSMLINKTHKRKFYIMTWGLASRAIWLLMGFLPLAFHGATARLGMTVLLMLMALSYSGNSLINVCWFPWFSDIAPLRIRGRWLSIRDAINSIGGLLFGLLVAYLLDELPAASKFTIIFLIGGAFGVMDMVCFSQVRDEWKSPAPQISFRKTLRSVLSNKPFMRFSLMWTTWCFTSNMAGSYLTPYAMNSMGLNYMQITVFGSVAASVATVLAVSRWGRMVDRFGSRNVMLLCCMAASLTQLFYLFSVPGSIWPTFLYNVIGAAFWSGSNLAANSMQLYASPDAERPSYIAVFACVTALAGTALGTLCGSWILTFCESRGLFAGRFDRYMALIVLATALRFGSTLLLVPRMPNERSASLRDMFRFVSHPGKK